MGAGDFGAAEVWAANRTDSGKGSIPMIRSIHGFVKMFVTAGIIAAGASLYFFSTSELYGLYTENVPALEDRMLYRQIGGIAIAVLALLAWMPRFKKRPKEREISFVGTHGEVTIALDPVEATLVRVVSKLPEVRNISITIKTMEGPGSVRVLATAILRKDGDSDVRLLTARVNSYIQAHTKKILGMDEVLVKLKVKRFDMNMKTVKPEPLLLEAPTPDNATESVVQAEPANTYRPNFQRSATSSSDIPEVSVDEDDKDLHLDEDANKEKASGSW